MPPIAAVILFLFAAADASGMRIIDISDRVKLCFNRTESKLDKIQSFLKAADHITYSLSGLKTSDKTAICSVIITKAKMDEGFEINTSGNVLRIFLSDDFSGWEKNYKTHSAIISALLLSRFRIRPDSNYDKVPAWMNAGILSKIEMRRNQAMLSGVTVYPGTRGLVSGDDQPDLWCVLNNPLGYGNGPSFILYSETCAIIIDSLARVPGSRDVFMAILKSAIDGKKPDQAFKTAINDYIMKGGFDYSTLPVDQLPPKERAELWFGTAVRNSSVNIFFPGSSDFLEKRLDVLSSLNYMVAAEPGKDKAPKPQIRSCKIHELGKKWNEIENPERIANIYARYFSDLSNQSPSLIQNDVNKIVELFSRLKDNDKEAFENEYRNAVTSLRGKIVKLRQLEDYMRECELKFIPFGKRFTTEFNYLEETGTFTRQFCPSLDSILDKEEKNF
jgi:hypothetical protein